MTTTTPGIQFGPGGQPRLATGSWRADPAHSEASFTAQFAGQPVRGRLPLTGAVLVTEPIEDNNAEHELACQLDLQVGDPRPDGTPRIIIASSWVIDSRWVTSHWLPALAHDIMTCSLSLEPDM